MRKTCRAGSPGCDPLHRVNITIRPLDASASDAVIEQLLSFNVASDLELYGACEQYTLAQRRAALTDTEYFHRQRWIAVTEPIEGGEAVIGIAAVTFPQQENLEQAFVGLDVHPAYRGQGVATQLIEEAVRPALEASGHDIVTFFGNVPADGEASDPSFAWNRVAKRLGASIKNVSIERLLALPVPGDRLDRLEAHAQEKAGPYRFELWDDEIPEEHVAAYGVLLRQLDLDDPDGDAELEAGEYTPERVRSLVATQRERGMRTLVAVAIAPDGQIVGNSEIRWSTGDGATLAWQENTLVMPEHRGHRLGLGMKVLTHRRISELAPDLRVLVTCNAAENPWMISVNEQLGYEIAFRENVYQGPIVATAP